MENVLNAIANVGFPIVCCITLARVFYKEYNRINKQNEKLIDTILSHNEKK